MARILVLEDDQTFLMELQFELEDMGHTVTTCMSAAVAYGALMQADPPYDLLISDIYILKNGRPIQDGGMRLLGLLQVLRASDRSHPVGKMPVLAMSGAVTLPGQSKLLDMAKKLGATEVLAKPFRLQHLSDLLDQFVPGGALPGLQRKAG
ncbi:MAG: response regulator [Rhodobacteraceae bacterium]|nr:response regulator [Paracoccaceae bacterium]